MSPEKKVSSRPTAFRYGGLFALGLIVFGLILQLTGIVDPADQESTGNKISNWINWIVIIVAVVMAINYHKKSDLGGFITFGQSVKVGTLTAVVIAVISALWTMLYMGVIDPELTEIIRENAVEEAEAQGGNMDAAMPWIEALTSPGVIGLMVFLMTTIMGLITSLIAGAIMKKEPPFA